MKEKIKIICLILITLVILIAVGFYSWNIWQKQKYYKLQNEIERCEKITSMKWDYRTDKCVKKPLDEFLTPKNNL